MTPTYRNTYLDEPDWGIKVRPCPCGCEFFVGVLVDPSERTPGRRRRSAAQRERAELVQMVAALDVLHRDKTQRERAGLLNITPSAHHELLRHPDRAPTSAPPGELLWTDERVKAAMRAWLEREGRWPTYGDWSPSKPVDRGGSKAPARAAFRQPWYEPDPAAPDGQRERHFPHASSVDFRRLLEEAQAEEAKAAAACRRAVRRKR